MAVKCAGPPMYVVKPLIDQAEPKAFRTAKEAIERAQTGAFEETRADKCEVHWVGDDLSEKQTIAAVQAGLSEKRAIIHRRLSPSIAFLRGLGS
jgi:hypothetical protein